MPPFLSVIFDFDYTLADSSIGVVNCVTHALREMGLPPAEPGAIRALIGVSLAETFTRLAGHPFAHRFDEFLRLFMEQADKVMVRSVHLLDSTTPTLETLLAMGLTLGIVSTKFRRRIEEVLRRERLERAFSIIVGGEDVSAHKPDPTGLLEAVGALGRSTSQVLYVGDSSVDAETARRAGVPFVAVLSGVTSREAFAGYETYAIIENLAELPALLNVAGDTVGTRP